MYECGHRDGAVIQFWPGDLFSIGSALDATYKQQPGQFEIFRKISNWRNYDDEYLSLSPSSVAQWQLEIEWLQRHLSGEEYISWREKRSFEENIEREQLLYGSTQETLKTGLELCDASSTTGNQIEFFW